MIDFTRDSMLYDLLVNLVIMITLVSLFSITISKNKRNHIPFLILSGIGIGIALILIMETPWWNLGDQFLDTRSIILMLSSGLYGLIPTVIAALIAIVYRLNVGGTGIYVGITIIIVSTFIGIFWEMIKVKFKKRSPYIEYFVLGLLGNIIVSGVIFLFDPSSINYFEELFLPLLIYYPIITSLTGVITQKHVEHYELVEVTKKQKELLTASLNATKIMEIYILDKDYNYVTFNQYHEQQMLKYWNSEIKVGESFFKDVTRGEILDHMKENFSQTILGNAHVSTYKYKDKDKKEKYIENHYSPIKSDKDEVTGITVFSYDVTEKEEYQQSIVYLSYHDMLTGLFNRRYFEEKVLELSDKEDNIVVVFFDVNGLKVMNDAFGHHVGDELLLTVTEQLKNKFDEATICRIGGDEFVVLLEKVGLEATKKKAEAIKNVLETKKIMGMTISISYGISEKTKDDSLKEVINTAEDIMYKNKIFEVSSHRSESIQTILSTLRAKNPREEAHSERVSNICVAIGEKLKMPQSEIKLLKMIANLHDLGKIGIDDAILNKEGKLTDEEFEIIKRHPEIGFRILSSTPEYSEIAYDTLSHHERYDGTGYPRGLKGENIPLRARIISVADAFDAMISDRPYRKAKTVKEAMDELVKYSGKQFDPEIVRTLLEILHETPNKFDIKN